MNRVYILLAAVLAFFALLVLVPTALDRLDAKVELPRIGKRYSQVLTEGAVLNKHGVYGVDFVRCGKCSVEKLRKGPLTFGGMNVLVLDDLKVVIPPREAAATNSADGVTAREIAGRMGVDDSFLGSRGVGLKFSGLRINELALSRLDGTNVVPVLSAPFGEARRDGLHLRDCVIIRETLTNLVGKALLRVRPHVRVEWDGGSQTLD